ncbi:MAG: PilZ domain-containing protein [Candidatus Omnitrophica bacterium]|nr:PilZ domain-containing protein [Candidatus Omnitrophota bacterium]
MEKNFMAGEERRRYQRVVSSLPVQYKNLRSAEGTKAGSLTKDIGAGGVRFNTDEFISLACRLVLEITIPTLSRPIKAISKVAWIKKIPTSDKYELGNQFLEMTKEDRAHITDFVSRVKDTNPQPNPV